MQPIQLNFKPSAALSIALVMISLFAALILIMQTFAWQIKLCGVLIIAMTGSYALLHYGLRRLPWSCLALSIDIHHQLRLSLKNGWQLTFKVQANSVVTPYLTVVNCVLVPTNLDDEPNGIARMSALARIAYLLVLRHYSVVILPDALDAESYRQLRVWLRWGKLKLG